MRLAARIVLSRWAITKLIRCRRMRSMAAWMARSVSVSTLLVASSMTNTCGSAITARASAISCFCPVDSWLPPSPTVAS